MLSDQDKRELLEMACSKRIREDFKIMTNNRYNPFLVNGTVDLDKFIDFLDDYNEFVGHALKPFRKIVTKRMLL